MKLLPLLKTIVVSACLAHVSVVSAQNKTVVIPLFEEKTIFTGVGTTGNTKCSEFMEPPGSWVEVTPCSNLSAALGGQDAELKEGASATPRYTVNGNGTVTDNLTGLIWLRTMFCAQQTADWAGALGLIIALNGSGEMAGNDCGDTSNNGAFQTDWRLPNLNELQTLVNFGHHASPYISDTNGDGHFSDGDPFSDLQNDKAYWSSTSYGIVLDDALRVNFDDGVIDATSKNAVQHVWAVRGGT